MKTILLSLVSALLLLSQTAPRPEQIRAPAADAPRVYLFLPSGQAVVALLDASLVLDTSGPVPVLRAVAAPAPIREAVEVQKLSSPATGLTCSRRPISEPELHINGVLYSQGEDYTRAEQQITLRQPAQKDDVISIRYRW